MAEEVRLDWNALLQLKPLIFEFIESKRAGEQIDLRNSISQAAEAFGITDYEAAAEDKVHSVMNEGFALAFDDKNAEALASIFASGCVPVMNLVIDYAQGEIGAAQIIEGLEKLRGGNIESMTALLQNAAGIPDGAAEAISDKLGPYTVSVYCLVATYRIYEKVAKDARVAKERRVEAERLVGEIVGRLKAERAEMDELVGTYLLDRILPFAAGVDAMDRAVLENDDDGFVHANAELWRLFGRDSQYSNAEEFDDLMLSDEAFKL